VTKPTSEAALLASLAQLKTECDEKQARFVRCCAELGAEIGKRHRAERQRDELLAALTKILAGLRSRKGTDGEGKLSVLEMVVMKKAIEEATGEKP
jgi:hypothetical protein